jgi:hypothetical protein
MLSVAVFLDRLAALEAGMQPFGADGPRARALLAVRGLTDERVAEASALMKELRRFDDVETRRPSVHPEVEQAADDLWRWYLEWSGVVRQGIADRGLLRRLGLSKRKRRQRAELTPDRTV